MFSGDDECKINVTTFNVSYIFYNSYEDIFIFKSLLKNIVTELEIIIYLSIRNKIGSCGRVFENASSLGRHLFIQLDDDGSPGFSSGFQPLCGKKRFVF